MDPGTALSVAGVALALPGLIQVSLDCHSRVTEILRSHQQAVSDAQEQWLLLDIHLSEIEADLLFLRLNAQVFQDDIQARLKAVLSVLNRSLTEVIDAFNSAIDVATGEVGRIKWILLVKPKLARLVPEIEAWQRRFMDYIQLLRFTGYGLQQQLDGSGHDEKQIKSSLVRGPVCSTADKLSRDILLARIDDMPVDALEIPPLFMDKNSHREGRPVEALGHTDTKLIWTSEALKGDGILVECRTHGIQADVNQLKTAVGKVAQILAAAGSKALMTHLLQSVGYAYLARPAREIQLFLKYPRGLDMPRTLRYALTSTPLPSINARLELSRQLATAVFYTHTSGLVHKSIRPESILIFRDDQTSSQIMNGKRENLNDSPGVLFLTGFQLAREDSSNAVSSTQGNQNWEYDIYTHPSRHGPGTRYTMAHDIYSLGVNLLEIALWDSFLIFDNHERARLFNDEAVEGGRAICEALKSGDREAGAELKQRYEIAAKALLPVSMGRRFRDIVLDCLAVMDGGFEQVDSSMDNESNGTSRVEEEKIGLQFIDKVLERLEDIQI